MDTNEMNTVTPAEETETTAETINDTAAEAETSAEVTAAVGDGASGEAAGEKQVDWFSEIVDILETMLISVFVILLIFTYLMRPVTVAGGSMKPTLYDSDKLVMYRLMYKPKMGDIVVVDDHGGHVFSGDQVVSSGYSLNECIIKRVIATAGHSVNIDAEKGEVYVDGNLLNEPYVAELTYTNDHAFEYPITIPDGYVFVMGDNRNHSTDSRSAAVGLVSLDDVMGTAYFRYYAAKNPDTGEKQGSVGFVK